MTPSLVEKALLLHQLHFVVENIYHEIDAATMDMVRVGLVEENHTNLELDHRKLLPIKATFRCR